MRENNALRARRAFFAWLLPLFILSIMKHAQLHHRPLHTNRFRHNPERGYRGEYARLMRVRIIRTTTIVRREIREMFVLADDDHSFREFEPRTQRTIPRREEPIDAEFEIIPDKKPFPYKPEPLKITQQ
jgi:hypothetical protein